MQLFFQKFKKDENGAVAVDWLVLCAAIVGLSVMLMTTVSTGTATVGDNISTYFGSLDLF